MPPLPNSRLISMCVNRHWVRLNVLAKKPLGLHRLNSASACSVTPMLRTNAFSCSIWSPSAMGQSFQRGSPRGTRVCTHPGWSFLPSSGDHGSDLVGVLQRHSIHTDIAPQPTAPPTSSSVLWRNPKVCTGEPHLTPLFHFHLVSTLLS